MNPSKEPSFLSLLKDSPVFNDNQNTCWLATTIQFLRNIEKYKFPGKLETDRRKQLVALVNSYLANNPELAKSFYVKGEEIGYLEKEFLAEHFLSFEMYGQAQAGEGFVIDPALGFIATLNLQDHIHMELIDYKGDIEQAWSRLMKIETELGKSINYSFLPKFGYLTADPTKCGTGMCVSAFLQVPGLVHTEMVDEVLDKYVDDSFVVTGIQGSPTEIIGDILKIENSYTIGVTEEAILNGMRNIVGKLISEESAVRRTIKKDGDPSYKDKVARAFGILIHSYQIEAIEALNAISILKLGHELEWLEGIEMKALNQLMFNSRRAHLLCEYRQENIPQEAISHKRAEHIHKVLKDVKLKV